MTVNDHKDSKTALLADYLLAASPDSLYLINTDSNDIYWPESKLASILVRYVPTLQDALDNIARDTTSTSGGSASADTHMAVMRLSNVESSAEQLLGQAVRGFPARLVVYTSDARATDTVFLLAKCTLLGESGTI